MAQGWPLLSQGQRPVYPEPRLLEHLSPELSTTHTATHNTKEGQRECLDCLGWSGCPQGGWQCPNAQWSEVITVLYKGSRHQLHRVTSLIRWGWGAHGSSAGLSHLLAGGACFPRTEETVTRRSSDAGKGTWAWQPRAWSGESGTDSWSHMGQRPDEPGRAGSQAAASTCPQHRCGCGTHLAQPWSCPQVPPWSPQAPWGCNPRAGQAGLRPPPPPPPHGPVQRDTQPEELITGSTLIVAEAPSRGRTETQKESPTRPTPSSEGGCRGGQRAEWRVSPTSFPKKEIREFQEQSRGSKGQEPRAKRAG